jgi:hypothetical protein
MAGRRFGILAGCILALALVTSLPKTVVANVINGTHRSHRSSSHSHHTGTRIKGVKQQLQFCELDRTHCTVLPVSWLVGVG